MTSGLRAIAASKDGLRCYYCSCPTGGELEHVQARSRGGRSNLENLVLSCPLCNRRKSNRDVKEFKNSGDWRLIAPALSNDIDSMFQEHFGTTGPVIFTARSNSFLENRKDSILLYVRPGRGYDWTILKLEEKNSPETIQASWDFLKRHHTPKKPRPRKSWRKPR